MELSRSQIAVYGAVAVALLLVGARALSPGERETAAASFGSASPGGGGPELAVDAEGGRDVVVDVTGAVRRPGVYRMPAGTRVTDAIERAGDRAPGRCWRDQPGGAACRRPAGGGAAAPSGGPAAATGATVSEEGRSASARRRRSSSTRSRGSAR